jgi:hypothetical protein
VVVGLCQGGDPDGGGGERHAAAGSAGADGQAGGQVGLPVPGGPSSTMFSRPVMKSSVLRWAIWLRLRPRAWSQSNSSRLAGGEAGGADAAFGAVTVAGGDFAG